MSVGLVDVCLEGILIISSKNNSKVSTEVVSVNLQQAIIRLVVPIALGETIQCVFQSNPPIELKARVLKFMDWKSSPKLALIEFSEVSVETRNKIQEMMDYYLQLKKAGVQLHDTPSLEGKLP